MAWMFCTYLKIKIFFIKGSNCLELLKTPVVDEELKEYEILMNVFEFELFAFENER